MARASAQAWRSARPECCTDRLPEVTPSLGLAAVVAGTMRDAGEIDVELVGDDLRERREDALADLDLAGEHLDDAVGAQPQPLRQAAIGLQAAGQSARRLVDDVIAETGPCSCRSALLRRTQHRAHDAVVRAAAAQVAIERAAHSASARIGIARSSAAAEIRMPEMQ